MFRHFLITFMYLILTISFQRPLCFGPLNTEHLLLKHHGWWESVIAIQRTFRFHFRLNRNDVVPGRKSILMRTEYFNTTASALKRKPPGLSSSVRTLENAVRQSVLRSPMRSTRKHASALGLLNRTVRIVHVEVEFILYEITIVRELQEPNWLNHRVYYNDIMHNAPTNADLFTRLLFAK